MRAIHRCVLLNLHSRELVEKKTLLERMFKVSRGSQENIKLMIKSRINSIL